MLLYEALPALVVSRYKTREVRMGKGTVIYSFGVNDERPSKPRWLAHIPSAQIYAFYLSVDGQIASKYASRAHFSKVGLDGKDEDRGYTQFFTLQSLMKRNKHAYIYILKIDIEGDEYAALDTFMDAFVREERLPVGQVMLELHLVDDNNVDIERFSKWWERLEGFGMRPTRLKINQLAITLVEGKTDPRCVEYSLLGIWPS